MSGRPFDARDTADAPPVAIVNETLARQLWPGANPLGRRMRLGPRRHAGRGDRRREGRQVHPAVGSAAGDALSAARAGTRRRRRRWSSSPPVHRPTSPTRVRVALQAIDPDVPVHRFQSMADYLEYGQAFLIFRIGALFARRLRRAGADPGVDWALRGRRLRHHAADA